MPADMAGGAVKPDALAIPQSGANRAWWCSKRRRWDGCRSKVATQARAGRSRRFGLAVGPSICGREQQSSCSMPQQKGVRSRH